MKNKYTKSQMKYIRKEKARIRSEFSDAKRQREEIQKVFDKMSDKLHIHPAPKSAEKSKKEGTKPKAAKEVKKAPVAKKEAKGTMKEEKAPVDADAKLKQADKKNDNK